MDESITAMREPKKIMLLGDVHGNTMWTVGTIYHAHREGADVIVQLGDFGWWTAGPERKKYLRTIHRALEECDITLYWVDGNHEDHSDTPMRVANTVTRAPWWAADYPRIIHLPRGFRWEWWDMQWMALGGAYSVDRHLRTEGKSWWPNEILSDEDVEYASREGTVDVIVAHDAPYGVDIPGIGPHTKQRPGEITWPPAALAEAEAHRLKVQKVAEAVKPRLFFHGHYHKRYQAFYEFRGADVPRMRVNGLDCDGTSYTLNTLMLNHGKDLT